MSNQLVILILLSNAFVVLESCGSNVQIPGTSTTTTTTSTLTTTTTTTPTTTTTTTSTLRPENTYPTEKPEYYFSKGTVLPECPDLACQMCDRTAEVCYCAHRFICVQFAAGTEVADVTNGGCEKSCFRYVELPDSFIKSDLYIQSDVCRCEEPIFPTTTTATTTTTPTPTTTTPSTTRTLTSTMVASSAPAQPASSTTTTTNLAPTFGVPAHPGNPLPSCGPQQYIGRNLVCFPDVATCTCILDIYWTGFRLCKPNCTIDAYSDEICECRTSDKTASAIPMPYNCTAEQCAVGSRVSKNDPFDIHKCHEKSQCQDLGMRPCKLGCFHEWDWGLRIYLQPEVCHCVNGAIYYQRFNQIYPLDPPGWTDTTTTTTLAPTNDAPAHPGNPLPSCGPLQYIGNNLVCFPGVSTCTCILDIYWTGFRLCKPNCTIDAHSDEICECRTSDKTASAIPMPYNCTAEQCAVGSRVSKNDPFNIHKCHDKSQCQDLGMRPCKLGCFHEWDWGLRIYLQPEVCHCVNGAIYYQRFNQIYPLDPPGWTNTTTTTTLAPIANEDGKSFSIVD